MCRRLAQQAGRLSAIVLCAVVAHGAGVAARQQTAVLTLRGRAQTLRLYGSPSGPPVIVSSGDGGWLHLGPHVAEVLAAHGCFVIGFDVRAYLASFTANGRALDPALEPDDYRRLIEFAAGASNQPVVLAGVSEGAGLSVLAAAGRATRGLVGGVIGMGLPDETELGWRWTDAVIYVTHGSPHEPGFRTSAVVDRVAPIPLAVIHSTHDEFVPLDEVRAVFERARQPKRFWLVPAANHRFSDNQEEFDRRLLEALAWVHEQAAATR